MTLKQIRNNQLDELKTESVFVLTYRVEKLNGSFLPVKSWTFGIMEEAKRKYSELLDTGTPAGFLRKYAVVPF